MKKSILGLALLAVVAIGSAFANTNAPASPKPEVVYTYYLEGDCDTPLYCSPEYTGVVCSEAFKDYVVYDAPDCIDGHVVSTIIGKRPI